MARTVTDAAIMLGALESAAPDPNDPATKTCTPPPGRDYTRFLKADGLKGARIGIPRAFFYDHVDLARTQWRRRRRSRRRRIRQRAQPRAGARHDRGDRDPQSSKAPIIVDPADIPSIVDQGSRTRTSPLWGQCSGLDQRAKARTADCSVVLKYGMKRDFNAWLATLGASAPVKTLTELRAVEHHAHHRRRHSLRPVAARYLRRDGRAGRPRALRSRSRQGHPAGRNERHRRGDEGEPPGRDPLPRRQRRRHRRASPATRR